MTHPVSALPRTAGFAAGYTAREVARLVDLTLPQIQTYVRSGCVNPRRGPRREYRFSFQDLVVLRTARALTAAMPARRVHRALRRLQEFLPSGRQLATVRITAVGDEIVVRDGAAAWAPDSGQAVLDLDVASLASEVAPLARQAAEEARQAEDPPAGEDWYYLGCELELCEPEQAVEAYRRAIEQDSTHADAHLNLGRLLHEAGRVREAETHYREALAGRPGDATAAYNLGVALEDLGRGAEAEQAYESALAADPGNAEAHFNLSRLCERLGQPQRALRHLQAYRGLIGAGQRLGRG
jgi:tetratricopeptide (TPR) repeat protein